MGMGDGPFCSYCYLIQRVQVADTRIGSWYSYLVWTCDPLLTAKRMGYEYGYGTGLHFTPQPMI